MKRQFYRRYPFAVVSLRTFESEKIYSPTSRGSHENWRCTKRLLIRVTASSACRSTGNSCCGSSRAMQLFKISSRKRAGQWLPSPLSDTMYYKIFRKSACIVDIHGIHGIHGIRTESGQDLSNPRDKTLSCVFAQPRLSSRVPFPKLSWI